MREIRILGLGISFMLILFILLIVYTYSIYYLFDGKEVTGNLFTIVTLSIIIISVVLSVIITRLISKYLKTKSSKVTYLFIGLVLLLLISLLYSIKLFTYVIV